MSPQPGNDNLHIRAATLEDAPAIARIHVSTWQEAYRGIVADEHLRNLSVEARQSMWQASIAKGEPRVLVAHGMGDMVGWIAFDRSRDEGASAEAAEVWAVYVSPTWWGKGIGRGLFRQALEDLRSRGFTSVSLWVLTKNESARRFYESAGFSLDTPVKTVNVGGVPLEEVRYVMQLRADNASTVQVDSQRSPSMTTSLVLTAIGPDQPGIVEAIADAGRSSGANWAESRMANLAGQFAGMVHFEVAEARAAALEDALRALESRGLRIAIARGERTAPRRAARLVHVDLVGHDRPGIVHELSESLASRGVSIEELHTQVTSAAMAGGYLFKVRARLAVPASLSDADLKSALESLANEMMVELDPAERGN